MFFLWLKSYSAVLVHSLHHGLLMKLQIIFEIVTMHPVLFFLGIKMSNSISFSDKVPHAISLALVLSIIAERTTTIEKVTSSDWLDECVRTYKLFKCWLYCYGIDICMQGNQKRPPTGTKTGMAYTHRYNLQWSFSPFLFVLSLMPIVQWCTFHNEFFLRRLHSIHSICSSSAISFREFHAKLNNKRMKYGSTADYCEGIFGNSSNCFVQKRIGIETNANITFDG